MPDVFLKCIWTIIFFCFLEIIGYRRPSVVLYIVVVTVTCIYIEENQSLSLHLSFLILYTEVRSRTWRRAHALLPSIHIPHPIDIRFFLFHSPSCSSPFYVRLFSNCRSCPTSKFIRSRHLTRAV